MEDLLDDAAKKVSSSSVSSKRPVGAARYGLCPAVGCSCFWGSFSDGAEVAPNTSVSPVGGEKGQSQMWASVGGPPDFTEKKTSITHQELCFGSSIKPLKQPNSPYPSMLQNHLVSGTLKSPRPLVSKRIWTNASKQALSVGCQMPLEAPHALKPRLS